MNKLWFWWYYDRKRLPDTIAQWIAMHLPKRVAYWAYIRVHASATTGTFADKTPDEVTVFMALKDWNLDG